MSTRTRLEFWTSEILETKEQFCAAEDPYSDQSAQLSRLDLFDNALIGLYRRNRIHCNAPMDATQCCPRQMPAERWSRNRSSRVRLPAAEIEFRGRSRVHWKRLLGDSWIEVIQRGPDGLAAIFRVRPLQPKAENGWAPAQHPQVAQNSVRAFDRQVDRSAATPYSVLGYRRRRSLR